VWRFLVHRRVVEPGNQARNFLATTTLLWERHRTRKENQEADSALSLSSHHKFEKQQRESG